MKHPIKYALNEFPKTIYKFQELQEWGISQKDLLNIVSNDCGKTVTAIRAYLIPTNSYALVATGKKGLETIQEIETSINRIYEKTKKLRDTATSEMYDYFEMFNTIPLKTIKKENAVSA